MMELAQSQQIKPGIGWQGIWLRVFQVLLIWENRRLPEVEI
jgi:hypothetical protein